MIQSDKLNAAPWKRSRPADLTFLAMTQFRLGQKAEAAATLGRLRETMKKRSFDRDTEDLFQEAERLIEPSK